MSYIHNHNISIYFTLPALKKRVLIIFLCQKLLAKYLGDGVSTFLKINFLTEPNKYLTEQISQCLLNSL